MITYFRMKQYFNQTRLLENLYNFALRAICIEISSIMFSQSVFTLSGPDTAVPEARPHSHCVIDLVCVLLLLCQVSQMCNFIIPDHQKQSPRYQDSLQISPAIVAEMLGNTVEILILVKSRQIVFDQMKHEEQG